MNHNVIMNHEIKVCVTCGKEFRKKPTVSVKQWESSKFCSKHCRLTPPKKDRTKNCLFCGKSFSSKQRGKRWKEQKFCSDECAHKATPHSNLGYKHSKKQVENWKESNKGKHSGENCNFWKGGITELNIRIRNCSKYDEWRFLVFQRDNFTCQHCNSYGVELNAHHKESFASILFLNKIETLEQALQCKMLWDILNGITLCKQCHDKIHGLNKLKE